jgi:hypothetical protein
MPHPVGADVTSGRRPSLSALRDCAGDSPDDDGRCPLSLRQLQRPEGTATQHLSGAENSMAVSEVSSSEIPCDHLRSMLFGHDQGSATVDPWPGS